MGCPITLHVVLGVFLSPFLEFHVSPSFGSGKVIRDVKLHSRMKKRHSLSGTKRW
ncbi:hypothetical protein AAZX31_13G111200 [Glycine max]